MKALITAGGRGTRLSPITHTQNKHLICIGNKPMIHYALETVAEAGIKEVGIIRSTSDVAIEEEIKDGANWGLRVTYIPQEKPLGLAHAVKISETFIDGEPFVFYLGDNILVGGIKKFVETFHQNKSNCHLVLANVKDPTRFGVAEIKNDKIISIKEKPKNVTSALAVAGIYIYDQSIFEAVNNIQFSQRGELEISDAHQYLVEKNKKVTYSQITDWWKDTGTPDDMLEANRLVLENGRSYSSYIDSTAHIDEASYVTGKVSIGKNTRIKNSVIRGPVAIGDNVVIENAFVGPFTSIYHDTHVVDSEIQYSIVLRACMVLNISSRIENSLLGNNVHIVSSKQRPRTSKFVLGEKSQIEIV